MVRSIPTASKLIDSLKLYDPEEATDLVVKTGKAKFDETVEISVRLGVDPRHADQQVRGAVVLPHGTGRTIRVLVIAKGDKAKEAEAAGADFVGAEDMIAKIQQENWFGFDVCVATPDMMGLVGRIGRVLGPKGLMPNPKSGTVTMDVTKAISDIKAGKVEYRVDKTAIVHCPIGKASFGQQKLSGEPEGSDGRHQQGEARRCQGYLCEVPVSEQHHGPLCPCEPAEVLSSQNAMRASEESGARFAYKNFYNGEQMRVLKRLKSRKKPGGRWGCTGDIRACCSC